MPNKGCVVPSPDWSELIVESVPCAILVIDRERRISLLNRRAEVLFDFPRGELMGQPLETLVPERARSPLCRQITELFAAPTLGPAAGRQVAFGRCRDGTEVPVDIAMNPIETSDGLFIVVSIVDITERQRAEEVEQRMAALVESAEDAILTKSLEGVVRSWNPSAERLLGYRADEMIGQPVTRLLPVDRQDEEAMILSQVRRGQRVAHFETQRRKRDGSFLDVSLTISPIRDRSGTIVGASKIMRDITLRKQSENELRRSNAELERLNSDLDDFVYTASHDLRAPLNGVNSVVQWILDDDSSLSAESRSRLLLIQGRIERMKRLLNDIRDYARTGRFGEASGPATTAAALVSDVAATCHAPPGFVILCDPSLEAAAVNRVPLEQIFHNLINNAIKHHDRIRGTVMVAVRSNGAMWRFSVTDDGPGIPAEYRETVFEMFKTLKPRDEVEGSGMGLALVRKIVGRMGGTCGIDSAGHRGSIVWFDWPREQPAGRSQ